MKIPFTLWLKCEHCGNNTVLFTNLIQTQSKCANGECAKVSRIFDEAKLIAYMTFLEESVLTLRQSHDKLREKLTQKDKENFLVRSPNGWRLVLPTQSSIAWAVNPTM